MLRSLTFAAALTAAVAACSNSTSREPSPAESSTGFFANGDVRLSYQLDLPARSGRVPAVVFGHGSGQLDKTSCRFLAGGFQQRGFATLCFDKRGVGQSGGEYVNVGTADSERVFAELAGDIAAGVRFLRRHPQIDGSRIGLAGASQAGWIVPLAATMARPAFMILLVGPAVSVGEEIFTAASSSSTTLHSTRPTAGCRRSPVRADSIRGRSWQRSMCPGSGCSAPRIAAFPRRRRSRFSIS